jgi:hypothetical protein
MVDWREEVRRDVVLGIELLDLFGLIENESRRPPHRHDATKVSNRCIREEGVVVAVSVCVLMW